MVFSCIAQMRECGLYKRVSVLFADSYIFSLFRILLGVGEAMHIDVFDLLALKGCVGKLKSDTVTRKQDRIGAEVER